MCKISCDTSEMSIEPKYFLVYLYFERFFHFRTMGILQMWNSDSAFAYIYVRKIEIINQGIL